MARLKSYIGDIHGKIGGLIFARNKGGAYIKSFARPTNPQTVAQQTARALLTTASSSWHALTDAAKDLWNQFAENVFKPKYPVQGVSYSGFNSFVSSNLNLLSALNSRGTYLIPTGTQSLNIEVGGINMVAPTFTMGSAILADSVTPGPSGVPVGLTFNTAGLSASTGVLQVSFRTSQEIPIGGNLNFYDDVQQSAVGILFVASLPGTQLQQQTRNAKYTALAATDLIGSVSFTAAGSVINFEITIPDKGRMYAYSLGNYFTLNAFLFNNLGQTQPLGEIRCQVT